MKNSLKTLKRKKEKFLILVESLKHFYFSYYFCKYNPNRDSVFINLDGPLIYTRYYYILSKYFLLCDYNVFVKKDLKLIYYLNSELDASFLIKEKKVIFGKPSKNINVIELDNEIVSPDYFNFMIENKQEKAYHIPIGQHPFLYFKNFWNTNFVVNNRIQSLFMAGNFRQDIYSRDENNILFHVLSRLEIHDFLKEKGYLKSFDYITPFNDYLLKCESNSIYIINRRLDSSIEPSMMRHTMGLFDFFFAMPGVVMPLCHNVIEAMSVGSIPFLQVGYAKAMRPPLMSGENCFTFNDFEDLEEKINNIFSKSKDEIEKVRRNVYDYYKNYLSPRVIVNEIVSGKYDKFYLMAEYHSVDLLKKDLKIG